MSAGAAFAGMQIAGTLLGGFQRGKALDAQAATERENARLTILQGEDEVASTWREARQVSGMAAAAIAESGAAMGTGTAADLLRETAFQAELEVAVTRNAARAQAADLEQRARDAAKAAKYARIEGVFGAVSAGLGYKMQADDRKAVERQRTQERWARRTIPRTDTIVRPIAPGQPRTYSSSDIARATSSFGVVPISGGR